MEKNMVAEVLKRYGLVVAVSLVLLLSVVDIFFVSVAKPRLENMQASKIQSVCQSRGDELKEGIPKISEIRGSMISEEAAVSSCKTIRVPICKNIDPKVWVLLLVSYVALLVFNLGYGMAKTGKIQWVWETVMTGIFIYFWFALDNCAQNLWYPLYVAKLALAIYAAYLYFFFRKNDVKGQVSS